MDGFSPRIDYTARAPSLALIDIVWLGDIEIDLWTKVRRASSLGVMERIATGFGRDRRTVSRMWKQCTPAGTSSASKTCCAGSSCSAPRSKRCAT